MSVRLRGLTALVLAGSLLTGCAGFKQNRGYIMDKELAAAVQPGVDNKDSVTKTLGRPTFTGQFDENEWYYVSRSTNTLAFRNPRVTDQTVLRIRFDQAGNVTAVDRTGKELVASIDPYGKETPTLGRKKSFFDEFFGNIGVINNAGVGGQRQPGQ
ncbi:outer membrane protein assembly factor BamE [Sphingomonas sp. GCM10030256]|uniref:outer membrane protein assembly factor BamE n=1 Tax=Sphingomonas sp. GCM10030256 TaxID=3273427 RepID=UPI00361E6DD2